VRFLSRQSISRARKLVPFSRGDHVPKLMRLAARLDWPEDQEFFRVLAAKVSARPRGKVAIIGGASAPRVAEQLRSRFPRLRLLVIDPRMEPSEAHVALSARNPIHLLVDLAESGAADQVDVFRRTFMHLAPNGSYLTRALVPSETAAASGGTDGFDLTQLIRLASDTPYDRSKPEQVRDLACLGVSIAEVRQVGDGILVRNARRLRPKLRDFEMNPILQARPKLGRVVESRPESSFESLCDYGDSYEFKARDPRIVHQDPYRLQTFTMPPLYLRLYARPICARGQIVESNGLLLPDTYRHQWQRRLTNMYINDVAPLFGEVRAELRKAAPIPGAYFHFDSEWPGHFGHTMTEQISRLWAYERAKEHDPELRLLTTLQKSRASQKLLPWESALLGAYGIPSDDVVIFDEPVQPERLYAATPMFSCPQWVHPEIDQIWNRLARGLIAKATTENRPKRIFCSRRVALKRACRNTAEVEEIFAASGFSVIYPEDYPLPDQAAMFAEADVIGGFAGSGLFSLAFCETPKTVIMISPKSYTARNEYQIASVRGHRLRVVWSRPDIPHPAGGWTAEAFGSSFAVDLQHEGRYLRELLASLES
jgi:capsular polysaccharide biosynthesis protein